jgi:tetratricopeptide (TPR) repeat protein
MRGAIFVGLLLCIPSWSEARDDPDQEIAARHFERGRAFYVANDYLHALEEFEAVLRVKHAPELEFNIARCHDRLEHLREAVTHYERYLAARPKASDAAEVRERVQVLKERIAREKPPAPKPVEPAPPPPVAPAPPPVVAPAPSAVVAPASPEREKPRGTSRRTTIAVAVTVVAVAVAAGAVGLAIGLQPAGPDATTLGDVRSTK